MKKLTNDGRELVRAKCIVKGRVRIDHYALQVQNWQILREISKRMNRKNRLTNSVHLSLQAADVNPVPTFCATILHFSCS
jgi:hypothetical protein